jgi:hypothetical protein
MYSSASIKFVLLSPSEKGSGSFRHISHPTLCTAESAPAPPEDVILPAIGSASLTNPISGTEQPESPTCMVCLCHSIDLGRIVHDDNILCTAFIHSVCYDSFVSSRPAWALATATVVDTRTHVLPGVARGMFHFLGGLSVPRRLSLTNYFPPFIQQDHAGNMSARCAGRR